VASSYRSPFPPPPSPTLFPYTTLFRSPGQLLLQADGAAIRTDAHGARGVETRQEVLRAIANGDGLRLDLRRVDGQGEFALDVRVNRAGSEGDRQPTTGFEDRQMRRTANADLAAFHKIDAC